jgi:hypothetical protein
LVLLDKTFLDADEYGSALVALEKLKMTSEDSVDGFLAITPLPFYDNGPAY